MQCRTPRALTALLDERGERACGRRRRRRTARPRRGSREGTVLVTGGTGGVGAFVLRELAAQGRPVLALARPESAHLVAGDGVEVVEGDLTDLDGLRDAVESADAVIHAACTFTRPEVDVAAMEAMVGGLERADRSSSSAAWTPTGSPAGPEVAEERALAAAAERVRTGQTRLRSSCCCAPPAPRAAAARAWSARRSCGVRTTVCGTNCAGAPPECSTRRRRRETRSRSPARRRRPRLVRRGLGARGRPGPRGDRLPGHSGARRRQRRERSRRLGGPGRRAGPAARHRQRDQPRRTGSTRTSTTAGTTAPTGWPRPWPNSRARTGGRCWRR